MLLLADLHANVNTEIPLWEVIVVAGGGIWAIIKLYFRSENQGNEITRLHATVEKLDKDCSDKLEEHARARKQELDVLNGIVKPLNDMVLRLDESMKHMTGTVNRLANVLVDKFHDAEPPNRK